jgi:hypothetical protein
MAPMKLYPQLKEAGCDAIIGFSYLADLLIFVEARKRDQSNAFSRVPIFTPFATVEPEKKLDLQNVFFFNLPPSHLVQSMFDYLNINHKISDPIIITEINRLEMQAYRDAYDRIFRKNKWPVTHISIHENGALPQGQISAGLKQGRTIVLLGGVVSSAKVINMAVNEKPLFVGTENFGSSTSMSLFNSLTSKNHSVLFVRQLDMLQKKQQESSFLKHYRTSFGNQDPSILAIYGYEAAKVMGLAVQKFQKLTAETIRKTKYYGGSGFTCDRSICEMRGQPTILRLTPNGYELAKP